MALLLALAGCNQPSSRPSPRGTAGGSATTKASPAGAESRCAIRDLQIMQSDHEGATGNGISTFKIVNRSPSACFLQGYPGFELVDGGGHHIADAARSLNSFFGSYPPPHKVVIEAGGQTTFDVTWGQNDPCGNTRAWRPAAFRVTPPDDVDSATVDASWAGGAAVVCPGTIEVHPVGSQHRFS